MMIDLRVGANASIKSKYIMIEDHGIIYAIDLVIINFLSDKEDFFNLIRELAISFRRVTYKIDGYIILKRKGVYFSKKFFY